MHGLLTVAGAGWAHSIRESLMRPCLAVALAAGLVCVAGSAAAQSAATPPAAPETYEALAYDLKTGSLLYRELHRVERDADGSGRRTVLYRCPGGAPFARKVVDYGDDPTSPVFELIDRRLGYREGVRAGANGYEVFVQEGANDAEETAPLPRIDGLVADAGFDDFVKQNWDALLAGETQRFPFLVPSTLDAIEFKVRKHDEIVLGGEAATVIRLSLGAWYAFLLPHIDVVYANESRQLRRFSGISNVRDLDGDNYKVRIEFPAPGQGTDPAALAAVPVDAPLVGSCR
jgi:hypothetical protein